MNTQNSFNKLVEIIKTLRGPEGCPWDQKQTHQSLIPFLIEESNELIEAINKKQDEEILNELGDVLLQVLLHAEIVSEKTDKTIWNVINILSKKMIHRHPHVFDKTNFKGSLDEKSLKENWARLKDQEKEQKNKKESMPENQQDQIRSFKIPKALPPLSASVKIGNITNKLNFDWKNPKEVLNKVDEELNELKIEIDAIKKTDKGCNIKTEEELGDLLFSICQLARHINVDPENAIRKANLKFEKRFFTMKKDLEAQKLNLDNMSNEQKEISWKKAKLTLNKNKI